MAKAALSPMESAAFLSCKTVCLQNTFAIRSSSQTMNQQFR